jgi:transcriptional regulator with XRE-family HTH domain
VAFARANQFGNLLRRWRDQRGMTQGTLAERAGVSSRHLSFLETGKAQPSREMVQRLGAVLQVPLHADPRRARSRVATNTRS